MRTFGWYTPWLLVGAAVLWVVVFGLFPFFNTVILSFTDARPLTGGEFIGVDNYTRLWDDRLFWNALTTTFIYVAVCVPLLTFGPLLVALLMQKKIPFIGAFRTIAYFPVIASAVVVALIWQWLFDSRGIINQALQFVGITDRSIPFLIDRWTLLGAAILLTVWMGLGYYMVLYLAALAAVNPELHEAAAIDGANQRQRFWNVTIPGVRNAMMLVAALVGVSAMRIFTELHVLTNGTGGPGGENISIVMLVRQVGAGLNGQTGYASAVSVVLFFLTLVPLLAIAWMNNRSEAGKS